MFNWNGISMVLFNNFKNLYFFSGFGIRQAGQFGIPQTRKRLFIYAASPSIIPI